MELITLEKLEVIMNEQILASRKKERQKAVAVNPFLAMMYKNMSFNVWRMIYGKDHSEFKLISLFRNKSSKENSSD